MKVVKLPEFKYNVNLGEEVPDRNGKMVLRYGRAKDRAYQYLGPNAPDRADGALYDRLYPLALVMPTNVKVKKGDIIPTGTGSFKIMPDQVMVS